MFEYTKRMNRSPYHVPENTKPNPEQQKSKKNYRALAGTLLFLGNGVLLQAAVVTSKIQQRLGKLRIQDIIDVNRMTREILNLKPSIKYKKINSVCDVKLVSLSDALHSGGNDIYGKLGFCVAC